MRTSGKRPALSPAMRPSSAASCSSGRSSFTSPAMNTGRSATWALRRSCTGMPCASNGSVVCSRPSGSTFGRRPVAASSQSKRSSCTLPSWPMARITTSSPSRRGSIAARSVLKGSSAPKTWRVSACRAGSVSGPTRWVRPYSRTRTPSRCSACASSRPMTPAPTTATEPGRSVQSKTSSLTISRSPSAARQAGDVGPGTGGDDDALRAHLRRTHLQGVVSTKRAWPISGARQASAARRRRRSRRSGRVRCAHAPSRRGHRSPQARP
jgi:hypothetical protein